MLSLSQQLWVQWVIALKKTSWIKAKVGDKVRVELKTTASSLETDPYACAIRIKKQVLL